MRTCILPALAGLAMLIAGCSPRPGSDAGRWVGERTVEGSTTRVRTISGSMWGGTATLVEEASIGTVEGEDEYILGNVSGIVVGDQRIFVLDTQVPTVRVYDLDGQHLMDIGREGGGPGEFRQPRSIAIDPVKGHLYVRDRRNGRINVYSLDGDPLDHWRISSSFGTSRPLVLTDDGHLYTMQLLNPGSSLDDWRLGMCCIGPEETTLDTIPAPVFDFEQWTVVARDENNESASGVPYAPSIAWTMTADRAMVGGVSDDYSFEIRWPDGRTTVVEKEWGDRVPVSREEAQWLKKTITENYQRDFPGWVWNGREIPGHKPAFVNMVADLSDRVWIARPGPSVRVEGGVEDSDDPADYYRHPLFESGQFWEVFSTDGRFLGKVDVPEDLQINAQSWIKDDMVVALSTGEQGEPYVKRFSLVLP